MANASCRPSVLLGRERGEREYPADKFVVTGKIRRINNLEISKVVSDGKISLQGRHKKKKKNVIVKCLSRVRAEGQKV